MRESIGQSFLVSMVITLVGVIIIILLCAIAYSKTFKIKTKLIDIIEKYNRGHEDNVYEAAQGEIEYYLHSIGYRKNRNGVQECPERNGKSAINDYSTYHYCIYEFDSGTYTFENRGKYYGVLVYIYFDFPIIGDMIEIPVYGETEVFFRETYIEG